MKNIKTSCKLLLLMGILIMLTACIRETGAAERIPTEPVIMGDAAQRQTPEPEETPDLDVTPDPDAGEKYQKQVFAMDTVMMLTAYGSNAPAALDAAEELIYALEADLDPESASGSVHALNAGAGSVVSVSEDCYNVMSTAMDYWRLSEGALDPGLYPLSKAWGFIGGEYRVPSMEEIAELLTAKKTEDIALNAADQAAVVPAGMEVSFGAVAKGYTAQAVCDLMEEMGVQSAILSLGGNVQTLGETKPDGARWQVAVTDPHDTGAYAGILTMGEGTAVTSGGYQRYFEQDGVTYIHIIDPETGCPVDSDLISVTVVTDDGAKADALSTALFVMGLERALEFYAERQDFEVILITQGDHVVVTPGIAADFTESEPDVFTYDYLG